MPGEEATPFFLDLCRRFLELSRGFLRTLLKALHHSGNSTIVLDCGFEEEVAQLRAAGLGDLVKHIDPKIRNSESHLDSQVIAGEQKEIVSSRAGDAECTYQQLGKTLDVLRKGVIPGFFIAFTSFQLSQFLILLNSLEYKMLLLREIQNRKE